MFVCEQCQTQRYQPRLLVWEQYLKLFLLRQLRFSSSRSLSDDIAAAISYIVLGVGK